MFIVIQETQGDGFAWKNLEDKSRVLQKRVDRLLDKSYVPVHCRKRIMECPVYSPRLEAFTNVRRISVLQSFWEIIEKLSSIDFWITVKPTIIKKLLCIAFL